MSLGDKIRELREKKRISQKELGEAIGVSDVMVSMYEQSKKRPSLDTIIAIADYFDVSSDNLLGREETNNLSAPYLSLAKEAEKNGIDPDDIRLAIETIRKLREGKR